jgi:hypothetical protein
MAHLTKNLQSAMRFLAILFLCLGVLTPQQPSNTKPSEAQTDEQKARAIIDRMIAAMGGQAYLNLRDSYVQGRYGGFRNEAMVATNVFFRYWKWPDSERNEITQGRDIVYLYLGGKAFEVTYRGGHELDPQKDEGVRQSLVRRRFALAKVLREWLNAPGTILFSEGSALAEGQMTEKITIINAANDAVTLMVSAETHLPVQKIFSIRDPQSRERDEEAEVYGAWRMVDGINTPWSILIKRNGSLLRSESITSVAYNISPPDTYFTPTLIHHEDDKKR